MKRFYRAVAVVGREPGYALLLDGRALHTPAGGALLLPTRALAEAVAAEWRAQGELIVPASMPLSQMAGTAQDRTGTQRDQVIEALARFGETDLLCYRAPHPADLAARQTAAWQPWLDWARQAVQADLAVTSGVVPVGQPPASLDSLRRAVRRYDGWQLTALQTAVPALGSLILALALAERQLDAGTCCALAQLDERFQAERWGDDPLAEQRRLALQQDVAAAARLLDLLREA